MPHGLDLAGRKTAARQIGIKFVRMNQFNVFDYDNSLRYIRQPFATLRAIARAAGVAAGCVLERGQGGNTK